MLCLLLLSISLLSLSVYLTTLLDVSTANCSNYKRFSLFDSYLSIYSLDTLNALIRSPGPLLVISYTLP